MKCDVFRELPFIQTTSGTLTIEETLKRLGDQDFFLSQSIDGFEFSASWRLLASITAVCLQSEPGAVKESSLPLSAIDKGLATLFEAENLFGGKYPFFQRLQVPTQKANKPTWKLSPTAPSDKSQSYWDLDKFKPETMQLSQAAMALIVFATYSFTGNSRYDGSKCLNGSPGIRYLGAGNTATEVFVKSDTLYESILKSIPKSWIEPGGLPAWADRTGEKSLLSDGSMHPLWQATWSSNTAACEWSESELLGVGTGGIPKSWFVAEMGSTNQTQKTWWDQRNTEDPFYLYLPNDKGELKARRLDLSKDLTELAVEWAKEQLTNSLHDWGSDRVKPPNFRKDSLLFVRHQISGNASSAIIRESVITVPDRQMWSFDDSPDVQEEIASHADFILKLRDIVRSPFRRGKGFVLDDLADLRPAAEDAFWREIAPAYVNIITTLHDDDVDTAKIVQAKIDAIDCAKRAFNRVLEPYLLQNPNRNLRVQQFVMRLLNKEARILQEEEDLS